MFYMGNGKLCVAMSLGVLRPVLGSNAYFVVFDFSPSKKGRTIFFHHTSMELFYTCHICNTMDYVPLGKVDLMQLLISNGAEVEAYCSGGGTPLHRSACSGMKGGS